MAGFDDTLGALLVCLMISLTLYGITIAQTYLYYTTYRDDRIYIKCLVLSLFILDSLNTVFISHAVYSLLATTFDRPETLMAAFENMWSISAGTFVTGIIAFLAQFVLGSRVWKMSHRNWLLTGSIAMLSLVQFSFTTMCTVLSLKETALFATVPNTKWILIVPYSCAVACDTVITGALCYFLMQMHTGYARTKLLINKLLVFTVNTGFWTTLVVVVDLAMFVVWPHNLVYVGVFFLLSKLYTNSLLTILNSRKVLRTVLVSSLDFSSETSRNDENHISVRVEQPEVSMTTTAPQHAVSVRRAEGAVPEEVHRDSAVEMMESGDVGLGRAC